VTREEARRLLSGYATGSLTELEQQLLFDAALEDQELFDELAEEQAVKELVELPGAKRRLLEALGPEKKAVVRWPWAVGVVAAMIGVALWIARPVAAPVEMARVETPIAIGPGEPAPVAVAPPAARSEPVAAEPVLTEQAAASPAPAEKAVALADNVAPAREETAPVPAQLEARAKRELPVLQPPAPKPVQAPVFAPQAFAPQALGGVAAAVVAPTGTLSYEVRDTGILRLTPTRAGVLTVTFDGRPLYPATPVAAGATIDVSIPLEAKQLRIDYAAAANAPDAAAQSGDVSGTLTLPLGPNPRAVVTIPAQR
jgi:hypothetical protein